MATAAPSAPALARERAFEGLYRRYVGDVYHYALALVRNPADAEDVTQTTFMNAYRAYTRGVEPIKPQNWLIKIAHNVARSRYARAGRRVSEVPLDHHAELLAVPEQPRADVEGVLAALSRLPFNQRAALVMRELEGRSYAEIAETLEVSVSAVETLIFRARRSLRLRSSALRVLTTAPLPASLSRFLEGGGLVAGGGAMAGTGFVGKAVIALVVGTMAAGVGGDRVRPVAAAPDGADPAAIAPPWAIDGAVRAAKSGRWQRAGARGPGRVGPSGAHSVPGALPVPIMDGTAASGSTTSAPARNIPLQPQAPLAEAVDRAKETLPNVVDTVDQVTTLVTSPLPALPVPLPSVELPPPPLDLPLPPVELPPLPVELPPLSVEPLPAPEPPKLPGLP